MGHGCQGHRLPLPVHGGGAMARAGGFVRGEGNMGGGGWPENHGTMVQCHRRPSLAVAQRRRENGEREKKVWSMVSYLEWSSTGVGIWSAVAVLGPEQWGGLAVGLRGVCGLAGTRQRRAWSGSGSVRGGLRAREMGQGKGSGCV